MALLALAVLLISELSFPPEIAASDSAESICKALRVSSSIAALPAACMPRQLLFEQQVKAYLDDAIKSGRKTETGLLIGSVGKGSSCVILSLQS